MAPQTRSSMKSPGRMTRNSVFGRTPLPPKTRSNSPVKPLARTAQPHVSGAEREPSNVEPANLGPGVTTTTAVSATGQGIHIRWHYPEDERDQDVDVEMAVVDDDPREVTPLPTEVTDARRQFPHTPMALQPYNAGSVILTPVKKARPLQPSPPRIGDKGVRCLYEKSGVLHEIGDGVTRIVLRHPVGSTANLSRQQVERLEDRRQVQIIQQQLDKLLAHKERMEGEARFSDSGYEDETEMDSHASCRRGLTREGTNETIILSHDELSDVALHESSPKYFSGPNGELLDRFGRQMFGREGTVLMDSNNEYPRRIKREEAIVALEQHIDFPDFGSGANKATGIRPRLGPEGTELID